MRTIPGRSTFAALRRCAEISRYTQWDPNAPWIARVFSRRAGEPDPRENADAPPKSAWGSCTGVVLATVLAGSAAPKIPPCDCPPPPTFPFDPCVVPNHHPISRVLKLTFGLGIGQRPHSITTSQK